MSIQAVREYLSHLWEQYQGSSRETKSTILNELIRNLGIHRKSAVRLMNSKAPPRSKHGKGRGGRARYSLESKEHLVKLWKMMGYMSSVRMHAALSQWIDHYPSPLGTEVKREILRMSARSIERFLKSAKAELRRKLNTGTRRGVRALLTEIPVRDLEETPTEPGHCEIDCVAHCGSSMAGTFAWTLTLTDITTGWTECEAVWGKNGKGIRNALFEIESRLPFPITHLYFDNGTEFLNDEVINGFARAASRRKAIEVARGRPYRKNDQKFVEQKNYTHVRKIFGYGRIDWTVAVNLMNRVYRFHWRLLQNYYCPQQKLVSKHRFGSRVVRKMDQPRTPFSRLEKFLTPRAIAKMKLKKAIVNPITSMKRVRKAVRSLYGYFKNDMPKTEWGKITR